MKEADMPLQITLNLVNGNQWCATSNKSVRMVISQKTPQEALRLALEDAGLPATRAADPSVLTASVLPPLPRYYMSSFPYGFQELYTADQMHDYARAALQTAQLSPVPVSVTEQMIDAGIAAGPLENSAIVRTTLLRTFRAMYAASQPSAQTEESA